MKISLLEEKIKKYLWGESSGHDYRHAIRVRNIARSIQEKEWWDLEIIEPAALLHDICRPRERETWKSHFWEEALEIIRWVIWDLYDNEITENILEIIRYHDVYDWDHQTQKNLELQIVQDADNLDAIWAIGVWRTFTYWWSHNIIMHDPQVDLDYWDQYEVIPWKHTPTTIAHFYEKLFKLWENMNTETWKKCLRQDTRQWKILYKIF